MVMSLFRKNNVSGFVIEISLAFFHTLQSDHETPVTLYY